MTAVTIEFSTTEMFRVTKRALLGVLLFSAVIMAAHCGAGCKPAQEPTQAEMNYTVQLQACSLGASTKAEARECRKAVNERFGLCSAPWPRITPCDD